jgi:hypothetical protein
VSNFRTLSASFALVRLGVRIHDSRRSTTDKLTSQRRYLPLPYRAI